MRPDILIPVIALAASPVMAQEPCGDMPAETTEIAEARLIIEYNHTDGDIGVHGYGDDDGWSELCLFDPSGALVLHVAPRAQLGELGLGSFFFESREPPEEVWDYAALKAAFPEGDYPVRAKLHDGTGRRGIARFTTLVPQPPVITAPALVEDEDEEAPIVPLADLEVTWEPVTASLDDRTPEITGYELIVTDEEYEDPDGFSKPELEVHLGPAATGFTVPAAFLRPDTLYEVEVLALEASGNQTIALGFFATDN
ncbi:hypothetical protein O4G76_05345 [Limimaricola sp. G21655-S1]|uniref:hypothetical protein n=1 Tax=Limimaricola sp. G21655-S1 TaxID=3014768 RepID=UPI0022AFCDFF|nr:hypothetical protein [Limimaricola sp. G21655-S1]MCZ4260266.1 hypothetical protein [Limimaricola sp. G21655-S1]